MQTNILIFLGAILAGPAMLQIVSKKIVRKKTSPKHESFDQFIKQLHKINSDSVT